MCVAILLCVGMCVAIVCGHVAGEVCEGAMQDVRAEAQAGECLVRLCTAELSGVRSKPPFSYPPPPSDAFPEGQAVQSWRLTLWNLR
jgi:hypothetical protein